MQKMSNKKKIHLSCSRYDYSSLHSNKKCCILQLQALKIWQLSRKFCKMSSILKPHGMYFTATTSSVSLFRIRRVTLTLPSPMSLSTSYLSMDPGLRRAAAEGTGAPLLALGQGLHLDLADQLLQVRACGIPWTRRSWSKVMSAWRLVAAWRSLTLVR